MNNTNDTYNIFNPSSSPVPDEQKGWQQRIVDTLTDHEREYMGLYASTPTHQRTAVMDNTILTIYQHVLIRLGVCHQDNANRYLELIFPHLQPLTYVHPSTIDNPVDNVVDDTNGSSTTISQPSSTPPTKQQHLMMFHKMREHIHQHIKERAAIVKQQEQAILDRIKQDFEHKDD